MELVMASYGKTKFLALYNFLIMNGALAQLLKIVSKKANMSTTHVIINFISRF